MEKIQSALQIIYSPSASNQERYAANQVLDELKGQENSHLVARDLFLAPDAKLKFFALTLLQHCLTRASLSGSLNPEIQGVVSQIVLTSASAGSELPDFVTQKVCKIFAEMLFQTLPFADAFPLLYSQLFQLAPRLVVLTLRDLSLEIVASPSSDRKLDLRNSVIALLCPAMSDLVPVQFYGFLSVPPDFPGFLTLLLTHPEALGTLETLVDWIPYQLLVSHNIAKLLFQALPNSMDASIALVSRNYSEYSHAVSCCIDPFLSDASLSLISNLWQNLNVPLEDFLDEKYPVLLKLCQLWVAFGLQQLCWKKADAVHPQMPHFLSLTLSMTASCTSLSMLSMMLSLWMTMLRSELLSASTQIYLIPLFDSLVSNLTKQKWIPLDSDSAALSNKCSSVDFESDITEFHSAFSAFRASCLGIIKHAITNGLASHAVDVCAGMISVLVQVPIQPGASFPTTSDYCMHWEATNFLLNAVAGSIPSSSDTPSILVKINEMISSLMRFEISDATILGKVLDALVSFSGFLQFIQPQIALSLIQKIFGFVCFRNPAFDGAATAGLYELSEDTIALRRKACTCLMKMATTPSLSGLLLSIYMELSKAISGLIDSDQVTSGERALLLEFLVAIVAAQTGASESDRSRLFYDIYTPMVSELLAIEGCVSTKEAFFEAIGLRTLMNCATSRGLDAPLDDLTRLALEKCLDQRNNIGYLTSVYKNCLSRTARTSKAGIDSAPLGSPWISGLARVLPIYLAIVKDIHSIWDMAPSSDLAWFLDMSNLEKRVALGMPLTEAAEQQHKEKSKNLKDPRCSARDQLEILRNWLQYLRECVYAFLGQCTYLHLNLKSVQQDTCLFYGVKGLDGLLLGCLFSENLRNYQWRSLLHHFVRPFLLNCPPDQVGFSVLNGVMPPLFEYLGRKLKTEWDALIASGYGSTSAAAPVTGEMEVGVEAEGGDGSVTDEIVQLKVLTAVTREWSDLHAVVFLSGKDAPSEKKSKPPTQPVAAHIVKNMPTTRPAVDFGANEKLVVYVLSTPAIAQPMLTYLTYSLTWKDSRTTSQSARLLARILPLLLTLQEGSSAYVVGEMLNKAMDALSDGYHLEFQDVLVSLILEIYLLTRTTQPQALVEALCTRVERFRVEGANKFDALMIAETAVSQQRKLMKEWLRDSMGRAIGQRKSANPTASGAGGVGAIKITKMLKQIENASNVANAAASGNSVTIEEVGDIGQLFQN